MVSTTEYLEDLQNVALPYIEREIFEMEIKVRFNERCKEGIIKPKIELTEKDKDEQELIWKYEKLVLDMMKTNKLAILSRLKKKPSKKLLAKLYERFIELTTEKLFCFEELVSKHNFVEEEVYLSECAESKEYINNGFKELCEV